jgi:hypothetical protein
MPVGEKEKVVSIIGSPSMRQFTRIKLRWHKPSFLKHFEILTFDLPSFHTEAQRSLEM